MGHTGSEAASKVEGKRSVYASACAIAWCTLFALRVRVWRQGWGSGTQDCVVVGARGIASKRMRVCAGAYDQTKQGVLRAHTGRCGLANRFVVFAAQWLGWHVQTAPIEGIWGALVEALILCGYTWHSCSR